MAIDMLFSLLENPTQVFCQYYTFLVQNMQPILLTEKLRGKKLLTSNDVEVISNAPTDHMRNSYILEHVRHRKTPELFTFLDILQEVGQKQVYDTLTDGKHNVSLCTVVLNSRD